MRLPPAAHGARVSQTHADLLPLALDTVKSFHVADAANKEEQSMSVVDLLLVVQNLGGAEHRLAVLKDIVEISVDVRPCAGWLHCVP